VRHLVEAWWAEAGKYNVLPLDDRLTERAASNEQDEPKSYTFYHGAVRIPEGSAPHTKNRSHSITAEIEVPKEGAEGPICAMGGHPAGWSLYIKDKKLTYCHNYAATAYYYVRSTKDVPVGKVKLRFEFEKTGPEKFGAGGKGRLYMNGSKVGEGEIPRTVPFRYSADETFDVGCDAGSPVSEEYGPNARFTGTVHKVIIELGGERHRDRTVDAKVAAAVE
jgi:hypothetical protein